MPKSYKICPTNHFQADMFSKTATVLDQQPGFPNMAEVASTSIRRASGTPGFEDFSSFIIDHDRVVKMAGRYGNVRFPEFMYTGVISAYYGPARRLLLLSGKKADVLSFCAATARVREINIDTLAIDMNALQESLPSVNLVWFRYKQGTMIRASALMGVSVEKSDAFVQAKSEGEISTLSFYLEDRIGEKHPVMVVNDGTVVLQGQYKEISTELGLVTLAYDALLANISTRVAPRNAVHSYSIALTPP